MSALEDLAKMAENIQQQYESGMISSEEYKELINDIASADEIKETASDLENDIIAKKTLDTAIQLAKMI
jgi:hypothetical protein